MTGGIWTKKECKTCRFYQKGGREYGVCFEPASRFSSGSTVAHESGVCPELEHKLTQAERHALSENIGQKFDQGKPGGFHLIPPEARVAMAAVLSYGQQKYGKPSGWRSVPNAAERYRDALDRHMLALDSGEECDAESGLPHLWHALCNAAFLVALNSGDRL